MDFEQELQELVQAAIEDGVDRDTIVQVLNERAAFIVNENIEARNQEIEKDEEDDENA